QAAGVHAAPDGNLLRRDLFQSAGAGARDGGDRGARLAAAWPAGVHRPSGAGGRHGETAGPDQRASARAGEPSARRPRAVSEQFDFAALHRRTESVADAEERRAVPVGSGAASLRALREAGMAVGAAPARAEKE